MKRMGIPIALVLAALLVMACGSGSGDLALEGTAWELVSLNGKPVLAGSEVTLRFEGDQVQGKASCNSYFGDFAVKGGKEWSVGMLANTEMFCMQPEGIMDQETAYLTALREANAIRMDGDALTIDGNGVALVFRKA